ncbi:unnamed protein product [Rhizoctonia solani]|uniref:Uncharacterized protein n=1 Tax=Rhizoctonia solani TaxID=456999 RepID=A0A8H3GCA0_9AGAM|nr:unnamed protein product [Rhizoctonia solani]
MHSPTFYYGSGPSECIRSKQSVGGSRDSMPPTGSREFRDRCQQEQVPFLRHVTLNFRSNGHIDNPGFEVLPCGQVIGTRFAMSETEFWAAEKYIPILGMLCGSTISGIVVATTAVLKELHENRDKVETYLAFGASRYEACKPIATSALRLALTPTINQMSVIGLISIPGMMTGAILGGASVDQAAKLQMVIMFMINACTTLASIVGMFSALYRAIDDCARIRSDRIFSEKFILWRARDRAINGVVDAGKAGYQKLRHSNHSSPNGNGERAPLLG